MPLLLLLLVVPLILVALTPFMLIQRYRAAKARRLARPWMATFAAVMIALSAVLFLIGAAVTSIWVAGAFSSGAAGMAAGVLLGGIGILLTKWEPTPRSLHYTPNRWLVLFVTMIVSARVLYGLYRSAVVAQAGIGGASIVMAFGIPQSLAAGGAVIGYYLFYNLALRWRLQRWQRRQLRVM